MSTSASPQGRDLLVDAAQSFADSCLDCHPGDAAAVRPHAISLDGMSLRADYRHEVCGCRWSAWWDALAVGWPHRRQHTAIPALLDEVIAILAVALATDAEAAGWPVSRTETAA